MTRKKEKRIITKMSDAFMEMLPMPGTPERADLVKEIREQNDHNCYWLEFELGNILKTVVSEFDDEVP